MTAKVSPEFLKQQRDPIDRLFTKEKFSECRLLFRFISSVTKSKTTP